MRVRRALARLARAGRPRSQGREFYPIIPSWEKARIEGDARKRVAGETPALQRRESHPCKPLTEYGAARHVKPSRSATTNN